MYLFSHHMLEEKNRENQHNLKSKIPKTRLVQEQSIRECTESFTTPVLSPSVTRPTLETPHLKLITDLKEPVLKLSKNVMIKKISVARRARSRHARGAGSILVAGQMFALSSNICFGSGCCVSCTLPDTQILEWDQAYV